MCECEKGMRTPEEIALLTFEGIPEVIREDVADVVMRNIGAISWPPGDLEYLFEVWNRYIAPASEPERITCPGCRAKVVSKMRRLVGIWNRRSEIR